MLRGELLPKYKGLCSEDIQLSEWLFGDELKSQLKDADLGEKITKSARNWRGKITKKLINVPLHMKTTILDKYIENIEYILK